MNFNLLVLRCADIETCKDFYTQLGLSFVKEKHGNGVEHYSSVVGGIVFEIYPVRKDEAPCNSRLGFGVENLESITSTMEIQSQYEFNGKNIYVVLDPDGRKIEVS